MRRFGEASNRRDMLLGVDFDASCQVYGCGISHRAVRIIRLHLHRRVQPHLFEELNANVFHLDVVLLEVSLLLGYALALERI